METTFSPEKPTLPIPPKLLVQVAEKIRLKLYSTRTEQSYVHWIKRYILFHDKRHPKEMGKRSASTYLTNRNHIQFQHTLYSFFQILLSTAQKSATCCNNVNTARFVAITPA